MATVLANNALLTLEEVRVAFGLPYPMDADVSGSYTLLINDASDYAESFCGRTFLSGSLATDVFDGEGASCLYDTYHTVYVTEQAPITGTPILERWNGSAWEVVARSTYEVKATEGEIYFPRSYSSEKHFVEGTQNYRVTYPYGLDGVANVYSRVKRSCILNIKFNDAANEHLGTTSTNAADNRSRTYQWDRIPGMIDQLLEPFVRTKDKIQ